MTDGIPTYCTGYIGPWWWPSCDNTSTGLNRVWNWDECGGNSSDCEGNACKQPIANAINAAQRLHDDLVESLENGTSRNT